MPLLAAMALTSCSNDEPVPNNSFDDEYDGQAYMRVRIAMPDGAVSRADENFVNGTEDEQAIKEIGLKFYNADGSFYGYGLPVEAPNTTVEASTADPATSIEGKVKEAVIVLQINSNAPKPTHVVAFANCGDGWKQTPEPNIDQIDQTMIGYTNTYDGKAYYAMTSSNYRDDRPGAAAFIQGYQTQVKPESFKPTESEALASGVPVDIYVERLAAKVKVQKPADEKNPVITNGDYSLKFVIDGYALGGTNEESYYIKHLDDQWNPTTLWTGWNSALDHRCYWAADMNYKNTATTPPTLQYVSYNGIKNKLDGTEGEWLYSTENTQTSLTAAKSPNDAQLIRSRADEDINRYLFQEFAYVIGHYEVTKADGTTLDGTVNPYLYEYAGNILTHDAMLKYMEQTVGTVLYKRTQLSADNQSYDGIDLAAEGLVDIGSYGDDASLVCLTLTEKATKNDAAELKQYYIKNTAAGAADGTTDKYVQVTSADQITALLQQSKVQAYGFQYVSDCAGKTGNGGYLAYFPILIKHLNTDGAFGEDSRGYYGVVRNHCYDITINQITGLGIGIFNPDNEIIPKDKIKPLYLAATFNILSWRHVTHTVDL